MASQHTGGAAMPHLRNNHSLPPLPPPAEEIAPGSSLANPLISRVCSLCQERFRNEDTPQFLPCQPNAHGYHSACFDDWYSERGNRVCAHESCTTAITADMIASFRVSTDVPEGASIGFFSWLVCCIGIR